MSNELLLRTVEGPIAQLTLNDPDRANVLSGEMMSALLESVTELGADPAVRVIVLGAAGKVFCAGHDLGELRGTNDPAAHEALFGRCSELMLAIRACPKPVIARVQGAAVAAGCQLVASCDLAFAVDTAKFAVSGINLGLFCSTPGVALGRAVSRKNAQEMLLTGRFVGAAEAAAMGLINRALPVDQLDAAVEEAANAIATKAPDAIALGKAVFNRQIEAPLDEAYAIASAAMVENLGFESAKSGIDEFLAR
ncbi:MAG TPA: enoyl-CoA hydratase [Caulobacteraceae bacterium]|jgi:enoyl-CoA hydratase/carnithine racemase|nr:enoyl-CoA hydratase [Caulobacteraceae bacterium]